MGLRNTKKQNLAKLRSNVLLNQQLLYFVSGLNTLIKRHSLQNCIDIPHGERRSLDSSLLESSYYVYLYSILRFCDQVNLQKKKFIWGFQVQVRAHDLQGREHDGRQDRHGDKATAEVHILKNMRQRGELTGNGVGFCNLRAYPSMTHQGHTT